MSKYQLDAARPSPPLLRLNVSGREYDVPESVARSHIGSIFSILAGVGYSNSEFQESERRRLLAMRRIVNIQQRWFIERTPAMFEIVLQYLYTRELHRPVSICEKALKDEMKFWRLQSVTMPECCWDEGHQDELSEDFDSKEFDATEDDDDIKDSEAEKGEATSEPNGKEQTQLQQRAASAWRRLSLADALKLGLCVRRKRWLKCKRFLWRLCHGPSSWMPARIFNGLCVVFTLVSIVNLILSTLPELQCSDDVLIPAQAANLTAASNSSTLVADVMTSYTADTTTPALRHRLSSNDKFDHVCPTELVFDIIEAISIAWFTVELILRFISVSDKRAFLKSPMNVIDILATAPYYVELALRLFGDATSGSVSTLMVVLRVLRMLRVFRVLRLARYFHSLKLFGTTVAKSREELGVLILFLLLSMIIFSSMMYYVEKDAEDTAYTSIPASFYWAVVTLTTTGYGDVTPKTGIGKTLASVACVAGILVLALPVSILVEHFNKSYKAKRARRRRLFDQDQTGAQPSVDFQYSESQSQSHSQMGSSAGGSNLTRSNSMVSRAAAVQSNETDAIDVLPGMRNTPPKHFRHQTKKSSATSAGKTGSTAGVVLKRHSRQSKSEELA